MKRWLEKPHKKGDKGKMKEGWQSFVIAMLIICGIIAGLLFFKGWDVEISDVIIDTESDGIKISGKVTNPYGFTLYAVHLAIEGYTADGTMVDIPDIYIKEIPSHYTTSFETTYFTDMPIINVSVTGRGYWT